MRLKRVKIKGYKNLNDFDCEFPDSHIVAFIGNNGSGKSNVLENIINTFYIVRNEVRSVNSDSSFLYPFDYTYLIDEVEHRIEFNGSVLFYYKNGKKDIKLLNNALPKVIFTYYAGETDRLSKYSYLLNREYFEYLKRQQNDYAELKFATTFSLKDFPLAFFASYVFDTPEFAKIKELLHFDSVDEHRILLHFKKPEWASESEGVKTIWGARGFNKLFYDKLLYEDDEYGMGAFVEFDSGDDYITLSVGHPDLFVSLAETPLELYTKFKAMLDSGLLQEMIIYVRRDDAMFQIEEFSEGEKQLANLLLLMDLTKEYKTLFLLDEFDAYLHPNWQRNFIKLISEIDIRGQVIFTTHSPATISGLRRESVFIMRDGQVYTANSETYNRALDEIMKEQMEVSMRSKEVDELISKFKQAVTDKDKEAAIKINGKLKDVLAEDDPFLITTRLVLERM